MALRVLFSGGTCTAISGFFVEKRKGVGSKSPKELEVVYHAISTGSESAERGLNSAFDLLFERVYEKEVATQNHEEQIERGSIVVQQHRVIGDPSETEEQNALTPEMADILYDLFYSRGDRGLVEI